MLFWRILIAASAFGTVAGAADWKPSEEEIREQRQLSLDEIQTEETAEGVATMRHGCVTGQQPQGIAKSRSNGMYSIPDAADLCVAVLIRSGTDGALLDVYRQMIERNGGDKAAADGLPAAIGGSLIKLKISTVPIGNGKVVEIKPALAFDAGFSAAYLAGKREASGLPDVATLKALAERCLDQAEPNLGLCYSTGYAQGVRALRGERPKVSSS